MAWIVALHLLPVERGTAAEAVLRLASLFVLLLLALVPGTRGDNRFGPP